MYKTKPTNLLPLLTSLTFIFFSIQFYLFIAHYKVSDLVDSLVSVSIAMQLLQPVILLPLLGFILLQVMAYSLWIASVKFVTESLSEWFHLSRLAVILLGIFIWSLSCFSILELNRYYFPESLFASLMRRINLFGGANEIILGVILSLLFILTLMAYIHFFWRRRFRVSGSVLLICIAAVLITEIHDQAFTPIIKSHEKPNIIIIGLDSLRPDFTSFYGSKITRTPAIDNFLSSAASYSSAYTPLARTFPAWMSILTAKYPKHHDARNNLVDPALIIRNETLAKKLQQSGYETIYATDEKRFSNITEAYGFDRILGPHMGVNDFLLGGLSDFPVSNLLVNLSIGRILFPYNYGNRAANITYQPDKFLRLVKLGLADLPDKPIFLAVHLCLSHWPSKWADKGHVASDYISNQYAHSVNELDKQFAALMQLLEKSGALKNSWVVILSDHGTALGLEGDRIIAEPNYQGDKKKMNIVPKLKLSASETKIKERAGLAEQAHEGSLHFLGERPKEVSILEDRAAQGSAARSQEQTRLKVWKPLSAAPPKNGASQNERAENKSADIYTINTAYGQGTNILSFTQNRVVLAFKRYGENFEAHQVNELASLIDIAPTILDMLDIPPLPNADGISLKRASKTPRSFFMETGDTLSEIETDHIYIEKVIKHEIGIYGIRSSNGLLTMNPPAAQSILKNKQLAILSGDWVLAHFPASLRKKKVIPAYFVLANVKTGQWTVEMGSEFAKKSPVVGLKQGLKDFYGSETLLF